MVLLYLAITLIVLYCSLHYFSTRNFNYWKKRKVPGPKPVPFFGNIKESALRRKNIGLVFEEMYNMFPNEKVVGIYRMTTPCLLIRDLEIIKHIMIKDFDVFIDRGLEYSKEGLGSNLFHTDGDTWRTLRSEFTSIFTSSKLKNMYYLLDEHANRFADYVQQQCLINQEQEIRTLVQKFTIASISACAFGVDIDTLHDKLDALRLVDKLIMTPSYFNELEMLFPGILKRLNLSIFPPLVKTFFSDLVKNIIIQRNGKPTNRRDFMDLILELRQTGEINSKFGEDNKIQISDDVIAAQAFVFYAAGYETSATTIAYLLHQLAVNQHIQDKVIAEIDESLAKNDGNITYDSLQKMKYLENAFSETLRMHSLVEPMQRKAKIDYQIPGTDILLKKDQIVLVSPRGIHYDEKYYPNPEVFDPDRFCHEIAGTRHPCAYLPFGIGPRHCIGMRFGQIQSRLCVAKFLSKFRVHLTSNTKKILDVEPNRFPMGPKGGIYLNVVPRS